LHFQQILSATGTQASFTATASLLGMVLAALVFLFLRSWRATVITAGVRVLIQHRQLPWV
jgi:hypothetical protein